MTAPKQESSSLKRTLGLPLLIFYGVGTILGLGIYVLLGKVAGHAGSLTPVAFIVAAVIATFTGLSYGELSARIPKSAGEVNYLDEAFGIRTLSASAGWLIVVSAIISTATVVNGYVGYAQVFVSWPAWLIIVGITTILGGIAIWGISESAFTITAITLIELSGMALVIFIAGDNLSNLPERWPELVPTGGFSDLEPVVLGAFLAFFTFIGFEDMVNVAEEAKNPTRDMPRAIVISLLILAVLYLVISAIAVFGLSPEELRSSDAPLADILARKGPHYPEIISAIGLVAIVNGVLVQLVMGARVLYGMAEKRMAPQIFHRVNPVTRTPIWATVFTTGLVLVLGLLFDLEALATATNYVLLVIFVLVNSSLVMIKRRDPDPEGIRTYPRFVPLLGAVLSFGVLVLQVVYSL